MAEKNNSKNWEMRKGVLVELREKGENCRK